MKQSQPVRIMKRWTEGGWFFGRGRKTIEVEAEQVLMPPPYLRAATAKVKIKVNGTEAFSADIPFPLLPGEIMLPLQVYLAALQPNSPFALWQKKLKKFCFMCKGFKPPIKIWWTKEPFFD